MADSTNGSGDRIFFQENKISFDGLDKMRKEGLFLDVTLVAEGKEFPVHRVVLSSCSDYFRALFGGGMRETYQQRIVLNDVPAKPLEILLNFVYNGSLPSNVTILLEMLPVASFLQLKCATKCAVTYLVDHLDVSNCLQMEVVSQSCCSFEFKEKIYSFICLHLFELSRTPYFNNMTFELLEFLLKAQLPVDCPENEVFKIVLQFINNHHENGNPFDPERIHRLLRVINFDDIDASIEMDSDESDDDTVSSYRSFIDQERHWRNAINPAGWSALPTVPSDQLDEEYIAAQCIVKIGGITRNGITNKITYFETRTQTWKYLTAVPDIKSSSWGVAVLNNNLYVVGGHYGSHYKETIHPFGYCYNPELNTWRFIERMRNERCEFSLTVLAGRLYAVGGWIETFDYPQMELVPGFTPCECYDPPSDRWAPFAPIPEHRAQHAAVAYPLINQQYLFVTGGFPSDYSGISLNTTWKYDAFNNSWVRCSDMLEPRVDHVMLNVDDMLYVCGGWREDEDTDERVLVTTIDRYDPLTDIWESITRVPTGRFHCAIFELFRCIYFVGGYTSDNAIHRACVPIDGYDLNTGTWTTYNEYPVAIWEHSCTMMYIPHSIRDNNDDDILPESRSISTQTNPPEVPSAL